MQHVPGNVGHADYLLLDSLSPIEEFFSVSRNLWRQAGHHGQCG